MNTEVFRSTVSGTLRSIPFESARFEKLRRFSSIVSRGVPPEPIWSQGIAAHTEQLTQLPTISTEKCVCVDQFDQLQVLSAARRRFRQPKNLLLHQNLRDHGQDRTLSGSIRVKVGWRAGISWKQIERKPCLGQPINRIYGNLYPGLSSQRYTFV